MEQSLNSCLYDCEVFHERITPKRYAFKNRLFWFCVDLDELPDLSQKVWGFSQEKWDFYSFRDQDFIPTNEPKALKERAMQVFKEMGVEQPIFKILLLGQVRTLGYGFNPISLFYALDNNLTPISALAQVENTFREIKLFPLTPMPDWPGWFEGLLPKHFYVSPYSNLSDSFNFQVSYPQEGLQVKVQAGTQDQIKLVAGLQGKALPLNSLNLIKMSLKYPLVTWQVIAGIHLHAALLYLKKVPFHWKAESPELQIGVLKPNRPRFTPKQ